MNIPLKSIVRMAVHSLRVHRIRTALALLGIIIGVAALITTVSVGSATGNILVNQVLSLGNNYILVQSGTFQQQGKVSAVQKKAVPIGGKDLEAIQAQIPYIEAISPVLEASKLIRYKGTVISGVLKGGSEDLFKIIQRPLKEGLYFSSYQVRTGAKVAILGSKAAEDLFGQEDPIGKTIIIDQIAFTVVGVLENLHSFLTSFVDPNLNVFVPYTVVWKKMIPTQENSYSYLVIRAEEKEKAAKIVSLLKSLLRFQHGLQEGMGDDFTILDQQELLAQARKAARTLDIFIFSAAGVAMIVGGIGIMNIMLVSITERKREIGLRMAIGASPNAILVQFLSESLILCLIGGVVGVLIGLVAPFALSLATGWPTLIKLSSIVAALSMALIVGLFFGLYPAYKASQLNPVEALRSY